MESATRKAFYDSIYGPSGTEPRIEIWKAESGWVARAFNSPPEQAAPEVVRLLDFLNSHEHAIK